jgi:hypothetical protein
MSKFNIPNNRVTTKPRKPQLILSGFGLQPLKAKVYNFGEDEEDNREKLPSSSLGTAVFDNLNFPKGSYKDLEGEQIDYDGVSIDTVLFSVAQNKTIIKTPIQGRNGSVKEYISDNDYSITIRGIITSDSPNVYPEKEVKDLYEVCAVQKEVEISSKFLNDVFGITNIVIESYDFPQSAGFQNTQMFKIQAVSDDPIELTLRQG